jgi:hypothetical protein
MNGFLVFATIVLTLVSLGVWRKQVVLRRERFIRSFTLPRGLFDNLIKRHPGLTLKQCQLVAHGLRQFFLAYLKGGRRFVSMPSQIADDLWHEFILFTRNYDAFCRQAFGGFLHHTPAVVLSSLRQSNAGLRRCWWHVCLDENINPKAPTRLPLLFALDAKLNVPNGFHYAADCTAVRQTKDGREGVVVYCGGDFSSDSFDGGTDGLGDAGDGGGGDGGSSGDGCGGGGCGGGGGD